MTQLINRGLKNMVDIVTGDANSARSKINKKQLAKHLQVSALHVVMEGIVECFNSAQSTPMGHILNQGEY